MAENKIKKLPDTVYFIESSNRDSTVLIAMDVYIDGRVIRWFDTVKERVMGIEKIIDKKVKHFVFERAKSEGGGQYIFVPLTIDIYNKKVKKNILIPQKVINEKKMLKAFMETRQNAW